MNNELQKLIAASAMITTLERIASSNVLPFEDEMDIRRLIIRAGRAFNLDALCERPSNIIDLETATLELVRQEMAR